jgi:hypothetical protein
MKRHFKTIIYILFVMVCIADFGFISPSPDELMPSWIFHMVILVGGFFIIMDRWVLPLKDIYEQLKDLRKH